MESLPLIGEIDPISQLFILAFSLSILFGAIARKTAFCPLGGIADIMQSGNNGRFRMYLFAIATAMLGVALLELMGMVDLDGTRPPYRMSQFRWPAYLAGGLLFGIGMTLCRGCGMKNMINLGSGNLKSIIAILGMGSAAFLMLYVEGFFAEYFLSWVMPITPDFQQSGIDHQDLGTLTAHWSGLEVSTLRTTIALLIATTLIMIAFRSSDFRGRRDNITGGAMIGLIIVSAFYLSGGPLGEAAQEASDFMDQPQNGMGTQSYTFIRPMGDLLYVLTNPEWYLVTFGLVAFLGVGAGSLLYNLISRSFQIQWFNSLGEGVRYLIGGIMVGIGGILGMGCTLGQGIAGTSTLALGSFVDLSALLIGAWIGIRMQRHFMDDHQIPYCDRTQD